MILKGTLIVSIVGLATLFVSIIQGGSDRTFVATKNAEKLVKKSTESLMQLQDTK